MPKRYWKGHFFEWMVIINTGSCRSAFQIKPQTEDFSLPISKSSMQNLQHSPWDSVVQHCLTACSMLLVLPAGSPTSQKANQWHHWKSKVREGTSGAGEVLHTITLDHLWLPRWSFSHNQSNGEGLYQPRISTRAGRRTLTFNSGLGSANLLLVH